MAKARRKKSSLNNLKRVHARARVKAKQIITAPLAIKAITIISYIAAATFILAGIGLFIAGLILEEQTDIVNTFLQVLLADPHSQLSSISPIAKAALSAVLVYSGPVLIALGLVFFFIGIFRIFVGVSLTHGKTWSRVVVSCFCIIWIGFGFYSITKGNIWINVITILFNLVVLYYLIFSREAHNFFHHIPNHHMHDEKRKVETGVITFEDGSQQKLSHFLKK